MSIRPFNLADTEDVVELWTLTNLVRPWNDPYRDIARKMKIQPDLFLVAEAGGQIIATAMAGYDGHRGSVYYLAVHPQHQGLGAGSLLMQHVEEKLIALGCPKLNIMIRSQNHMVADFYKKADYDPADVTVYGKRLIPDAYE